MGHMALYFPSSRSLSPLSFPFLSPVNSLQILLHPRVITLEKPFHSNHVENRTRHHRRLALTNGARTIPNCPHRPQPPIQQAYYREEYQICTDLDVRMMLISSIVDYLPRPERH